MSPTPPTNERLIEIQAGHENHPAAPHRRDTVLFQKPIETPQAVLASETKVLAGLTRGEPWTRDVALLISGLISVCCSLSERLDAIEGLHAATRRFSK